MKNKLLKKGKQNFDWGVISIFLIAGILRFFHLGEQPLFCDEAVHNIAAKYFLSQGLLSLFGHWHHPPFKYYYLRLASYLFGEGLFAFRFFSALAGALSVLALFFLVREVVEEKEIAYLASFLLAIDLLHTSMSRIALEDAVLTFFVLLASLFYYKYIKRPKNLTLFLSSLFFGLSLAIKWQALVLFPAFIAYFILENIKRKERLNWGKLMTVLLSFLIIGFCIYVVTYFPWFQRGYSFFEWLRLQAMMGKSVAYLSLGEYRVGTRVYQPLKWFFFPSYIIFFIEESSGDNIQAVVTLTTYFLWVLTLPSLLVLLWKRKIKPFANYLLLLFIFSFLPLVISSRPIFLYSATAVAPFVCYFVAHFLYFLFHKPKLSLFVVGYLGLILLNVFFFYPVISGMLMGGTYKQVLSFFLPF